MFPCMKRKNRTTLHRTGAMVKFVANESQLKEKEKSQEKKQEKKQEKQADKVLI